VAAEALARLDLEAAQRAAGLAEAQRPSVSRARQLPERATSQGGEAVLPKVLVLRVMVSPQDGGLLRRPEAAAVEVEVQRELAPEPDGAVALAAPSGAREPQAVVTLLDGVVSAARRIWAARLPAALAAREVAGLPSADLFFPSRFRPALAQLSRARSVRALRSLRIASSKALMSQAERDEVWSWQSRSPE
jgi:hypothetical protein